MHWQKYAQENTSSCKTSRQTHNWFSRSQKFWGGGTNIFRPWPNETLAGDLQSSFRTRNQSDNRKGQLMFSMFNILIRTVMSWISNPRFSVYGHYWLQFSFWTREFSIQWRAKVLHIFPRIFLWPSWGRGAIFGTSRLCEMEFSKCLIFSRGATEKNREKMCKTYAHHCTMGIPWCHLEAPNQPAGNDQTITISNLWGHCALNIVTLWMDYMYRSTIMEKMKKEHQNYLSSS